MKGILWTLLLAVAGLAILQQTALAGQFKPPVYYKVGTLPYSIVTADFNHDGLFFGQNGPSVGRFASGGDFHGLTGTPTQDSISPGAGGAFAGAGLGFFVTNAGSVGSLGDHFATYTIDTPVVSLQLSKGGGIWSLSTTFGRGGLFAGSVMTTNTTTAGTAACNGG